jgi:hypothetical protein
MEYCRSLEKKRRFKIAQNDIFKKGEVLLNGNPKVTA